MFRSHLTQTFLNYFDETDSRVRELPYTLDAQLLNSMATGLEDNALRLDRELRGRFLARVPLNLDNRGVYYSLRIPAGVTLPQDSSGVLLPPTLVEGRSAGGSWVTLTEYNDQLPVPSSLVVDDSMPPVRLSDPVLCTLTGTGNPQTVLPALPLSNRLTFWLDDLGAESPQVVIRIEGESFPRSAWVAQRQKSSELLTLSEEGPATSRIAWEVVDNIVVHGLPQDARLRCYALPAALEAVPDPARPFSHSGYRDEKFGRFWQLNGQLLQETYFRNRFAGREYVQSYLLPRLAAAVAVEPNTYGLYVAAGTTVYYADRREPMPEKLDRTVLTEEPLWGLDVVYDTRRSGNIRYLEVRPMPYARSGELVQHRYLLQDPAGVTYAISPEGSRLQFRGSAGWRRGTPLPLSLPLVQPGTYLVTLETMDHANQVTRDVFPYPNLSLAPLATFDLSDKVPNIQGLAFDSWERLWVWTGSFALPLVPRYGGYIFDAESRTLYLTDSYAEVRIS